MSLLFGGSTIRGLIVGAIFGNLHRNTCLFIFQHLHTAHGEHFGVDQKTWSFEDFSIVYSWGIKYGVHE
jgi:hypothetical protein